MSAIDTAHFTVQDYLGKSFPCSCGRVHSTPLRAVRLEQGAMASVPGLMEEFGYVHAMIYCDGNTYRAAGERLCQILKERGVQYTLSILSGENLVPDERMLGEAVMAFHPGADVIIAVGTGTLNDLCKFLSYRTRREYFIVATAPSMDGFASSGGALITDHLKVTYETGIAQAIIADPEVLCAAPMDMVLAGVGDILGKYTCLADWRLSHVVTGEYFCPIIAGMITQSVEKVLASREGVAKREPDAVLAVMEALVLSGIAMSFAGNSRPASGSEHHISHYWEMKFLMENRPPVLHGRKVGVGAVVMAHLYHSLSNVQVDFAKALKKAQNFDQKAWEALIHRTYSSAAPGVIRVENQVGKNEPEGHKKRIEAIREHWKEILQIAESVPSACEITAVLSALGAPCTPAQVDVDSKMLEDSILVAKEVRDRYTVLQLLWDIGLLDEMSREVPC